MTLAVAGAPDGRSFKLANATADLIAVGILSALTLVWRAPRLTHAVYGDEAWYFYLSKTWGADRHWVDFADNTASHLAYRPLFYALYFPVTQLGLEAARAANLLVGTALVATTFLLARAVGCGRLLSFLAGLVVVFHPRTHEFGTTLFPDTTTTLFLMLGVLAMARNRLWLATALFSAAVLCKEVSFMFAGAAYLALLLGRRWPERTSADPAADPTAVSAPPVKLGRALAILSIPVALLAVTQVLGLFLFNGRPQGWSANAFKLDFLQYALLGPIFIPFAIALLICRRWLVLGSALALPVFYFGWATVAGRGVDAWYQVSMIPFAAVAYARGVADIALLLASRVRVRLPRPVAVAAQGLVFAAVVPWYAWDTISVPRFSSHVPDMNRAVAALQRAKPDRIALVECFWGYPYYPLRTQGARVRRWYLKNLAWDPQLPPEPSPVLAESDVMVLCGPAASRLRELHPVLEPGCSLLSTSEYEVIKEPGRCLGLRRGTTKQLESKSVAGSRDPARFGITEMRRDGCTRVTGDSTLRGENCVTPFPIFGPYVPVREGDVVTVKVDLRVDRPGSATIELVGDLGQRVFGSATQPIVANSVRSMSFRLRVPASSPSLEARLGLSPTGRAGFDVTRFELVIE